MFVPASDTLSRIDAKYGLSYDVLSAPIFSIVEDPHWPLWRLANLKKRRPLCPSSWWRGMVCGVGLSKQFLEEVKRISEKNGVLYFIEIMIPSFAHASGGGSLTHKCIPELDNIVYRATDSPGQIRSDWLYHPIKGPGHGLQEKFSNSLRR